MKRKHTKTTPAGTTAPATAGTPTGAPKKLTAAEIQTLLSPFHPSTRKKAKTPKNSQVVSELKNIVQQVQQAHTADPSRSTAEIIKNMTLQVQPQPGQPASAPVRAIDTIAQGFGITISPALQAQLPPLTPSNQPGQFNLQATAQKIHDLEHSIGRLSSQFMGGFSLDVLARETAAYTSELDAMKTELEQAQQKMNSQALRAGAMYPSANNPISTLLFQQSQVSAQLATMLSRVPGLEQATQQAIARAAAAAAAPGGTTAAGGTAGSSTTGGAGAAGTATASLTAAEEAQLLKAFPSGSAINSTTLAAAAANDVTTLKTIAADIETLQRVDPSLNVQDYLRRRPLTAGSPDKSLDFVAGKLGIPVPTAGTPSRTGAPLTSRLGTIKPTLKLGMATGVVGGVALAMGAGIPAALVACIGVLFGAFAVRKPQPSDPSTATP